MPKELFDVIVPNPAQTAANLTIAAPTIINLPVGWNLQDCIVSIPAALTPAMLTQIILKANGNPVQWWYGYNDLDKANQENGFPSSTVISGNQFLRVPLRRLVQQGGRDKFKAGSAANGSAAAVAASFVSGAVRNQELSVGFNTGLDPISATAGILGITNPTLELWFTNTPGAAQQVTCQCLGYPMKPGGAGLARTVAGTQIALVAGVNTLSAQNGLKYGTDFLRETDRVILVPSAGTISNFSVYKNQTQYRNRSLALNQFLLSYPQNFRVDQSASGVYTIDFTERAFGDESLKTQDTKSNIQIQFTASTAGTLTIYQDGWGNPMAPLNT